MINYLCIGLSLVLSFLSMPLIIQFCKKLGLYDYQNARKIHKGNIPRLGGIGMVIAFFVSSIIFLLVSDGIKVTDHLPVLCAAFIIFVFAILDDILNLSAIFKLIVQLIAVTGVTYHGYRFTQIFGYQLPTVVSFILTFGWILGVINAYNLIDGLDGLCGNLSLTTIITLGILFTLSGNSEATICFILAAAILGFLIFNWPPAKLFMGDNGSQFLGFMVAIIPLYTSSDFFEYNKFLIMIVLTSFPVLDTIAAIWRRTRDRRPIMSPDKAHLHHKLLNIGYSQQTALYLITCLQVLLCASVVVSYFLGTIKGTAILFETLAFMVVFFSIIHYTNRKLLQKRREEASTKTE